MVESALGYDRRRRLANRVLAHRSLADRRLPNRRLLVDRLRARQVCSDGGGQHTERGAGHYQEFQHEHSPNHEGQKLDSSSSLLTVPRQLTGGNQQDRNRFSGLVWLKYHAEAVPAMLRLRSAT